MPDVIVTQYQTWWNDECVRVYVWNNGTETWEEGGRWMWRHIPTATQIIEADRLAMREMQAEIAAAEPEPTDEELEREYQRILARGETV